MSQSHGQSQAIRPGAIERGSAGRDGVSRTARALGQMTLVELKLFFREPAAAFFTLGFPLIILFVFGGIFGNDPDPDLGGRGGVDTSVPGYIGMIIGTTALIGLPIVLSNYREVGILRRLRATPVHPGVILGAQVLVQLLASLIGVVLLVVVGRIVFDLMWPEAPVMLLAAFLIACLGFYALGFALAGLLPSARTAQAVGSALYFPMLFLSGASFPRELMPDGIRTLSEFLPLTQVVILIQGLWYGDGWDPVAVAVLAGLLVVGAVVSVRTFRWE